MSKYQESSEVDVLIIGAGIIGLATAYQLAQLFPRLRVLVVEKNRRYGQETSSRSSEVIHAGMYYPAASLKARFCVEGNRLLYDFCASYQVKHQRLGKIIIAVNDEEVDALRNLYRQGLENGVELEWLEEKTAERLEPGIRAAAGIWSPNTGIIDSDGLMRCLYQLLLEQGVICLFNAAVEDIEKNGDTYYVNLSQEIIETPVIINCAGLYSDQIAALSGMDINKHGYRLHYCKGEYYRLSPAPDIKHLIYPLPEKGGLGIHITRDLAGGQRLGPNAYYVEQIDYGMTEDFKPQFFRAVKRYLPALKMENLHPDYTGIRPKLQGENDSFRDFIIKEEGAKGFPGFINLIGIESPGLTSCLAIGRYVTNLLESI
ncbi:MAG: NAD(P)/FAD-dependent oxidoreductase [Syntrophomonadaceae bacterium]|nr:NAD(P)/FAD-dependent oxidoreductase [Syntrophomonadaceae bacterium]